MFIAPIQQTGIRRRNLPTRLPKMAGQAAQAKRQDKKLNSDLEALFYWQPGKRRYLRHYDTGSLNGLYLHLLQQARFDSPALSEQKTGRIQRAMPEYQAVNLVLLTMGNRYVASTGQDDISWAKMQLHPLLALAEFAVSSGNNGRFRLDLKPLQRQAPEFFRTLLSPEITVPDAQNRLTQAYKARDKHFSGPVLSLAYKEVVKNIGLFRAHYDAGQKALRAHPVTNMAIQSQ